jgi:hypothetical protein
MVIVIIGKVEIEFLYGIEKIEKFINYLLLILNE